MVNTDTQRVVSLLTGAKAAPHFPTQRPDCPVISTHPGVFCPSLSHVYSPPMASSSLE